MALDPQPDLPGCVLQVGFVDAQNDALGGPDTFELRDRLREAERADPGSDGRSPGCSGPEQASEWVIGGEVTGIEAGAGLVGGGAEGPVTLAVDPELLVSAEDVSFYADARLRTRI